MPGLVELRRDGEVALIVVDNPPVNALKHDVRTGLIDAFTQARDDAERCRDRALLRRPHIHCRRRHHRIRQAAAIAGHRRCHQPDRLRAKACDRRLAWNAARRRARSRARLSFSRRRARHAARAAGDQAWADPGRRRHAAFAAACRPGKGIRHDPVRGSDCGGRGARRRLDRRDYRRRLERGRHCLCAPRAGGKDARSSARATATTSLRRCAPIRKNSKTSPPRMQSARAACTRPRRRSRPCAGRSTCRSTRHSSANEKSSWS